MLTIALLNRLNLSSSLEVLQEVCLGKVKHFRGLDLLRCLVKYVDCSVHIIRLKGEEARVLHSNVGHRLSIFLAQSSIERLVVEFLDAFV